MARSWHDSSSPRHHQSDSRRDPQHSGHTPLWLFGAMNANAPVVDEAAVLEKWAEISPLIDRMMERVGTREEFPVGVGSALAGDDTASTPYQVSHCVRMCMTAGVDHLHALKVLVVDSGILHVAAPFSLSRGALENFAAAFWMLHPPARDTRVERALRWHAKNFKDQETAVGQLGLPGHVSKEDKLLKLDAVAQRRGIPTTFRSGYFSSEAVTYAEERSTTKVLLPWQLCSGFAHGRPWAYLGASGLEETSTSDPGVSFAKLTSSMSTVLYPALEALRLLQDLLRLYKQRSQFALDTL